MQEQLQGLSGSARKGLIIAGKVGSRLARQAGGRWIPGAMKQASAGMAGASKVLNKGANRLRKNVKTFAVLPGGGQSLPVAARGIR
ncbi:MAG: hypothetical protein WD533_07650 [Dehalococcoidia bacterium]